MRKGRWETKPVAPEGKEGNGKKPAVAAELPDEVRERAAGIRRVRYGVTGRLTLASLAGGFENMIVWVSHIASELASIRLATDKAAIREIVEDLDRKDLVERKKYHEAVMALINGLIEEGLITRKWLNEKVK